MGTAVLNVGARKLAIDEEGFLECLDDWDRDTAAALAGAEGIELQEPHWEIIHAIRQFYADYDHAPPMRALVKFIKISLGANKARSVYLLKLFPGSPALLAAKIAGLPRPDNCL